MLGRTLLATLATLLLAAPVADAALTVSSPSTGLVITGGSVRETVRVTPSSTSGKLLVNSASGMSPGSNCTTLSTFVVQCTDRSVVRTDMGAGDDEVTLDHSIRCDVCFLGSGHDRFRVTSNQTTATGSDFIDGESGADDMDPGAGTDTALYTERLNDMRIELNGTLPVSGDVEATTDNNGQIKDRLANFENAYGGGGSDRFVGNASNNKFVGGASADTFIGQGGVDTVSYIPDVYDTTHINRSVTAIIGGGPVSGQAPGIDSFGGTGDDIGADIENLHGGNNGDRLIGDADSNTLVGNGGDDFLEGRAGRDGFAGNLGNDTVSYADRPATEPVTLLHSEGGTGGASDGPAGSRETVLNDIENFLGGRGNDTLTGDGNANLLDGGPGRDSMDGNGGLDTVSYASRSGDDLEDVRVELGSTGAVQGGALDSVSGLRDTIADIENATGGSGDDALFGRSPAVRVGISGVNVLKGGPGDDLLDGAGGSDDLFGDSGSDTANYSSRTTSVTATASGSTGSPVNGNEVDGAAGARDRFAGIENIRGGTGDDTLNGDSSGNRLEGLSGNDTLSGGFGSDTLDGGFDADVMNGGGGSGDTVTYELRNAPARATIGTNDINGTTNDGPTGGRDDIGADVENLTGGDADDILTGTDSSNTLRGLAGDDTLIGLGAGDRLEGGEDDDSLRGGLGNDTHDGDGGIDTASYAERSAAVFAALGTTSGNGQVGTGESDNLASEMEDVEGGSGGDSLIGSSGPNTLAGNGGEDLMDGGSGPDVFEGGDQRDTVTYESRSAGVTTAVGVAGASGNASDGAAAARDTINADVEVTRGTAHVDTLTGAAGAQTLEGLGNSDTLDGLGGPDTLNGGDGATDVASYAARTAAVEVRLETSGQSGNADDGAAGSRDSITGVENARGGSEGDLLVGSGAANRLEGMGGDDTMNGRGSADTIVGGDGARDLVTYEDRAAPVSVRLNTTGLSGNADDGNPGLRDTLDSTTEGARGGIDDDTLTGSNRTVAPGGAILHPGADVLEGIAGDDTLDGGTGPDDINGGDDNDTVTYAGRTSSVFVSLTNTPTSGNGEDGPSGGRDTLTDVENAEGGSGGDELLGFGGRNVLRGNGGGDVLDGGFGPDAFEGGEGNDTVSYESRTVAVTARIGVAGASGNADDGASRARDDIALDVEGLTGGAGPDRLHGTPNRDTLDGDLGNDRLFGRAGADTLRGGEGGADEVSYSDRTTPVRVVLDGTHVSGNEVDDTGGLRDAIDGDVERVTGGSDDDVLIGNKQANRLTGGRGDDVLQGLEGPDVFAGGTDFDVVSYAEREDRVVVVLGGGRVSGDNGDGPPAARDNVLRDVEGVLGGSGGDDLTGTPEADRLVGGPGPDTLRGLAGNDTILGEGDGDTLDGGPDVDDVRGGTGDDSLDGGADPDSLQGDQDIDTVTYASRTAGVRAGIDNTANSGNAEDGAAGARDVISLDVENLTGGNGGDQLTGNDGPNRLDGGDGADALFGAGDVDTLLGGRDPDALRGQAGNDTLDGGGDADDIRGNEDTDLVTYDSRASAVNVRMGVAGASGNADDGAAGARDSINADVEDLEGTSDDDTLAGGANDNTIDGGEGVDVIRGLGGLDTITYEGRPDPVDVNLGVVRGSGNDVDGPPGNRDTVEIDVERVVGTSQNDLITGSSADNILEGGFGADQMDGLGGTDTVTYEQRVEPVTARIGGTGGNADDGAGDTIALDVENLVGGVRGDTLTGDDGSDGDPPDAGVNTLVGGLGDDTLAGGEDPDRFDGGSGTDTVTYAASLGAVTATIGVAGGSGGTADGPVGARDTIEADVENLIGSALGDDDLTGSSAVNRIEGLDGDDALNGLGRADQLLGGGDVDVLDGGGGPDVLSGGTSSVPDSEADVVTYATRNADVVATIAGGPESGDASDGAVGARDTIQSDVEQLIGGSGNDTLTGINAANRLTGNAGKDTLVGAGRADELLGGAGDDTLEGDAGTDDLDGGNDDDTLRGGTEDDELVGGDGDDTLEGGDANDDLFGGVGADTLLGDAGLDSLFGEENNDSLDGGVGRDISSGGTGNDTATYLVRTVPVVMVIGEEFVSGDATDEVGGQRDTINTDVENLVGGEGDDTLTGNADPNRINGFRGNDDIFGGTGNDTLLGGSGDDEIDGQADDDTIRGEAGLDTLFGGFGVDTLFGGLDNDDLRIRGDATQDTAQCDEGNADTVTADAIDTVDATTCETVLLP